MMAWQVEDLARTVLHQPLRITVGERNTASTVVHQRLVFVGREAGKLIALRQLLTEGATPPILVRHAGCAEHEAAVAI